MRAYAVEPTILYYWRMAQADWLGLRVRSCHWLTEPAFIKWMGWTLAWICHADNTVIIFIVIILLLPSSSLSSVSPSLSRCDLAVGSSLTLRGSMGRNTPARIGAFGEVLNVQDKNYVLSSFPHTYFLKVRTPVSVRKFCIRKFLCA